MGLHAIAREKLPHPELPKLTQHGIVACIKAEGREIAVSPLGNVYIKSQYEDRWILFMPRYIEGWAQAYPQFRDTPFDWNLIRYGSNFPSNIE